MGASSVLGQPFCPRQMIGQVGLVLTTPLEEAVIAHTCHGHTGHVGSGHLSYQLGCLLPFV